MNISAQTNIVGKIPSYVIRIVVDDYVVAVPHPIGAVVNVVGRDGEEKSANIESVRPTTMEPPYVLRPNSAFEVAVLPRMIQMVMRVAATRLMSNPAVVFSMNVRSFRVVRLVVEFPVLILRRCRSGSRRVHRSGTVGRDMTIPHTVLAALGLLLPSFTASLTEQWQTEQKHNGENQ